MPESELKLHMDHGDLLGNCPDDFQLIDENKTQDSEGETGAGEESTKLSVKLDGNSANIPDNKTASRRVSTSTPTPTEAVKNDATFRFFIKLQGINAKKPARLIDVTFKNDKETHTYKNVRISPNTEGIYFGQLDTIPSGIFNISFKTSSHLRETFEDIRIQKGLNTWYFENNPLIAGDFNSDNVIDLVDIALFLAEMNSTSVNADQKNEHFDVDVNAKIDMDDLKLILKNYDRIIIEGE